MIVLLQIIVIFANHFWLFYYKSLWLLYCIHFVIALLHSYDCSITNHCDFCKSFLIVLLQIILIALLHSFCDCSIAFILWLLYYNSGGTFPRQTSKSKVEVYQSLCVARVGVAWGERTVHQASNAPLDGSAPTYWSVCGEPSSGALLAWWTVLSPQATPTRATQRDW